MMKISEGKRARKIEVVGSKKLFKAREVEDYLSKMASAKNSY